MSCINPLPPPLPFLLTQYGQSGSIPVSGQPPTYPSPNPALTLNCYQLTFIELGEGWVGSCPDSDIDPTEPPFPTVLP